MAPLTNMSGSEPPLPLKIVVCGGGNGAQTSAAILGLNGHSVSMLYSPVFAHLAIRMTSALADNGNSLIVRFAAAASAPASECRAPAPLVTTDAASVVPSADVVLVCVDGPSAAITLKQLAPYLSARQLLVMLPAMGAVAERQLDLAVAEARAAAVAVAEAAAGDSVVPPVTPAPLPELPMFIASKTLPWACRARAPAVVDVCGTKACVDAVVGSHMGPLLASLLPAALDSLLPGTHFVRTGLLMERSCLPFDLIGNSVLHPGMMYGTWADWDGTPLPERPPLYHGCTQACVDAVEAMESEAMAVIRELCRQNGAPEPEHLKTIREDLAICYLPDCDPTTLGSLLRSNGAYKGITHPMRAHPDGGFVPDFSARLLAEDVPCGLCALVGAAEILGVDTPAARRVVEWAQERLGKEYLVNGRMCGRDVRETDAPQTYGAKTAADLLFSSAGAVPAVGTGAAAASVVAPCAVTAQQVPLPAAALQPAH